MEIPRNLITLFRFKLNGQLSPGAVITINEAKASVVASLVP
jgi:hypothetical protein